MLLNNSSCHLLFFVAVMSSLAVNAQLSGDHKKQFISEGSNVTKLTDEVLKSLPGASLLPPPQQSASASKPHSDEVLLVKSQPSKHVDTIVDKLRAKVAETCAFGANPRLLDICPDLARNRPASFLASLRSLTLSDIRESIVNISVVAELQKKCYAGEWCLEESVFAYNKKDQLYVNQLNKNFNSKFYCALSDCFADVFAYIQDCVHDELERSVLNIAPKLCTFYTNVENQFCPEQTMRLIHVAVAAFSPRVGLDADLRSKTSSLNVCQDDLIKKKCSSGCKSIALSVNKIESCCSKSVMFRNFTALNWYYESNSEIISYCQVPVTSICFSYGKYYLGISPDILIFSVIGSAVMTAVFLVCFYACCCRRGSVPTTEHYEYAHLNEDEDHGSHGDEDEKAAGNKRGKGVSDSVGFDNETKSLIYDFNNNNQTPMSEFVNSRHQDLNIRGLMN